MSKKNVWQIVTVLFTVLLSFAIIYTLNVRSKSSMDVLSKVGDKSEEVKSIQTKLQEKGYYNGSIDGVFGEVTKNSVAKFQSDNGLTSDGIAGAKTLEKLGLSGSSGGTSKYNDSEVSLLARIISAESRGEPYSGQVAVGAVILNRIEHPSFPDTLAGVIYQPGAFSCLNDGQVNAEVYESSKRAAADAINGMDPSGGAIYYYNPEKTSNSFMLSRPVLTVIGKHKFCS